MTMESNDIFNRAPGSRPTLGAADSDEDQRGAASTADYETHASALAPLDPFDDDQGIEYWLWNGVRLVPAWPDEIARIREQERVREELFQAELRRQRAARWQGVLRRFSWATSAVAQTWANGVHQVVGFPVVTRMLSGLRGRHQRPPHSEA